MFGFVCLMASGRLTDEIRSKLLRTALEMGNKKRQSFRLSSTCEGEVVNTRKTGLLGFFGGTIFEAEVESDLGKATVRYLVDTSYPPEIVDKKGWGWHRLEDEEEDRAPTYH